MPQEDQGQPCRGGHQIPTPHYRGEGLGRAEGKDRRGWQQEGALQEAETGARPALGGQR